MDLELKETGNGGDVIKNTNDLSVIEGFENMIYLGLFGGNVASDTPQQRLDTEQAFDFWGNNLLLPNDPSTQFNSQTERTLNTVVLNSAGRVIIEEAIKSDLAFMNSFAQVAVDVVIISTDRIAIGIMVRQPDNLQEREFVYIWDATNKELTDREFATITSGGSSPAPDRRTWDFSFSYTWGPFF